MLGLSSALSWGTGDFLGGFASKKQPVITVMLVSQLAGAVMLLGLALLLREPWPLGRDLALGGVAGVAGMAALATFYKGLSVGRMGVVAPLAAVTTAVLPVLTAFVTLGWPAMWQLVGFGLALVAVWLLSGGGRRSLTAVTRAELAFALLAGLGFGIFFVLIGATSPGAVFWPLVAARSASLLTLTTIALTRGGWVRPRGRDFFLLVLAGLFDAGGNAFYALAVEYGRLDIAAVLASLYPASTVLLARIFLNERLNRLQWVGVGLALVALVFIAL
ncbi:MAG: DMT family transporter [Anaerolineales bacterium]|nr:DMT family transporter [Anaerolineales bacterium]